MKTKILLFAAILLQTTFLFGQNQGSNFYTNVSKDCFDNMKYVLDHLRSLKTCEQAKADNDPKFKQALAYLTDNCAYYAAEHNKELNAEKDRIQKLCDGRNVNSNNTQATSGFVDNSSNDPVIAAGNQVMSALGNLAVEQREQAKANVEKDAQRENVELSKLDIEPDNEFVNSPDDYLNVSMTIKNLSNYNKLGTVNITRKSPTIFVSEDDVKIKVYKAAKINAAFLGANTLYVKSLDFRRILADKPVVEIFGFAYNNKSIDFSEVENTFKTNKLFTTSHCYKYNINDVDFNKDKCNKSVEIIEAVKTENGINVNAKIEGIKFTSFKLIHFSKTSFTLMYFDKDKEKIYNYVVATQ